VVTEIKTKKKSKEEKP